MIIDRVNLTTVAEKAVAPRNDIQLNPSTTISILLIGGSLALLELVIFGPVFDAMPGTYIERGSALAALLTLSFVVGVGLAQRYLKIRSRQQEQHNIRKIIHKVLPDLVEVDFIPGQNTLFYVAAVILLVLIPLPTVIQNLLPDGPLTLIELLIVVLWAVVVVLAKRFFDRLMHPNGVFAMRLRNELLVGVLGIAIAYQLCELVFVVFNLVEHGTLPPIVLVGLLAIPWILWWMPSRIISQNITKYITKHEQRILKAIKIGRYDEALAYIVAERQRYPYAANHLFLQAYICQLAGRNEDAIQLARNSLAIPTTTNRIQFSSMMTLGRCHKAQKEYTRAMRCFEAALEILPDDNDPLVNIAEVYLELGNNAERALKLIELAKKNRRLSVRKKSQWALVLLDEAWALALLKQTQSLRDLIVESHAIPAVIFNEGAERYYTTGRIFQALGQTQDAVRLFHQAIDADPHGGHVPKIREALAEVSPTG